MDARQRGGKIATHPAVPSRAMIDVGMILHGCASSQLAGDCPESLLESPSLLTNGL